MYARPTTTLVRGDHTGYVCTLGNLEAPGTMGRVGRASDGVWVMRVCDGSCSSCIKRHPSLRPGGYPPQTNGPNLSRHFSSQSRYVLSTRQSLVSTCELPFFGICIPRAPTSWLAQNSCAAPCIQFSPLNKTSCIQLYGRFPRCRKIECAGGDGDSSIACDPVGSWRYYVHRYSPFPFAVRRDLS